MRQRLPRIECPAFLAFVRRQPCCACGAINPIQAAHIRMANIGIGKRETGIGEKASDRWVVPLCVGCHLGESDSLHRTGERAYWERIGLDPFRIASKLYADFLAVQVVKSTCAPEKSRTTKIRKATPRPKRKWPKVKLAGRPFPAGRKFLQRQITEKIR